MIARQISFRFGRASVAALAALLTGCLTAAAADGPEEVHKLPAPPKVLSKPAPKGTYGVIDENLFTVFGTYVIPGQLNDDGSPKQIWTRSYQNTAPVDPKQLRSAHLKGANQPPQAHIPGPTFVFKPDDFLRIRLHNFLNRSDNPWLNELQNNLSPGITTDELPESAAHEVNIPHGFNETNLHVHGLHVDPKQDNVTVLILPQDGDPSALSPDQQGLVQNINQWWQRRYQYKIPTDHLPGTHWYHSHRHGSTSIQVENGMAGALVIQPKHDKDDIVPGLAGTEHDRVMVVQEIQNYAVNAGSGKGKGPEQTAAKNIVVTVNGKYAPTLQIPQGQVERWRFIIAGANHQQQSNIWVGKIDFSMSKELFDLLMTINKDNYQDYIGNPPKKTFPSAVNCDYSDPAKSAINGTVNLVAIDGVTLSRAVPITAQTPTFGSSGNRSDLLVQADPPPARSAYFVFKNYPTSAPPIQGFAAAYPELFDEKDEKARWRYLALSRGQLPRIPGTNPKAPPPPAVNVTPPKSGIPANVPKDPYNLGASFAGFKVPWANNVQSDGSNPGDTRTDAQAITPIITGVASANKKDPITVAYSQPGPAAPNDPNGITGGRWQPAGGAGGGITQDYLMYVQVVPPVAGPKYDPKSLNAVLNTLSPTGNPATTRLTRTNEQGQTKPGIPSYVAPFGDKVDFQRTVTFDHSSTLFQYEDKTTGGAPTAIQQFWIDGRQFSSTDFVGNPAATSLIQRPIINEMQTMGSFTAANGLWTNQTQPLAALGQIAVSDPNRPNLKPTRIEILNTNAGYYRPVTLVTPANGKPYYTYNYGTGALPDYKSVTGFAHSRPPMAGTSEEWMLVNNSDIYHPFHIHISPFFVEEVGQLHTDGKTWSTRKIIWDSKTNSVAWEPADLPAANRTFGWVVGNWWDTILIPPHGYIRFKTWINIPDQKPTNRHAPTSPTDDVEPDDWKVTDNANVFGSWVFHCHILRHEDRGMMSMVAVTPRPHSLQGVWSDGKQSLKIYDSHGTVRVYTGPSFSPPYTHKGRFSEGLGNPFQSSPWSGSMNFNPSDPNSVSIPFCAAYTGPEKTPFQIVFANGASWLKQDPPVHPAPPVPPVQPAAKTLTGQWKDLDGNVASITQLANAPDGKSAPIQITPVTPVWWAAGNGSWNIGQGTNGFQGTLVYNNNQTTSQQLSFCVSADQNTIIFSNGIRWIRTQ